MKAFTTFILLSILAAATNALQVDEPDVSLYFDYIVDGTIVLAKESNGHRARSQLLSVSSI